MSKHRGHGEGSVYMRSDGRWASTVTLQGGKRKSFYGKTRKEAADKLTDALKARKDGLPAVPERVTVAGFLTRWLETAKPTVRPTTLVRYREYVELHTVPTLGQVRLTRLTPQHLQDLYAARLAAGMSSTSVRHLHAVLHRALSRALRWGLVARNVAEATDPPRRDHHEIQPLNFEEARRFLEAVRGDRLEALFVLAILTGARLGELLAVRWAAIDLDEGTLQVKHTLQPGGVFGEPKSAKGRRQIALPPLAVEALRRHRVLQMEKRLAAGPAWADLDLVFCNSAGNVLDPNNLRKRSLAPLLQRAGLRAIRFHDLRHSAASLLLAAGTHPKVLQELLGHSSISLTMDTYSHLLPGLQRDAMLGLERRLRA